MREDEDEDEDIDSCFAQKNSLVAAPLAPAPAPAAEKHVLSSERNGYILKGKKRNSSMVDAASLFSSESTVVFRELGELKKRVRLLRDSDASADSDSDSERGSDRDPREQRIAEILSESSPHAIVCAICYTRFVDLQSLQSHLLRNLCE